MFFQRSQLLTILVAAMFAAGMGIGADRLPDSAELKNNQANNLSHADRSQPPGKSGELMREDIDAENPKKTQLSPKLRHIWMEVTAYCPCSKCCGPAAEGITASGLPVTHNSGRFVAADTRVLPFGAQLQIPGYHQSISVPVIDRGGAIKGNKLDVFYPTHEEALEWGRKWLLVAVVE